MVTVQGAWTRLADGGAPWLRNLGLIVPVIATVGLLVFGTAIIILEWKKFEMADDWPSLAWAPFITWLWS